MTPQRIVTTPAIPIADYPDEFGNVRSRLTIPPGGVTLSCDFTIRDSGEAEPVAAGAGPYRRAAGRHRDRLHRLDGGLSRGRLARPGRAAQSAPDRPDRHGKGAGRRACRADHRIRQRGADRFHGSYRAGWVRDGC